ncbi:hypothetical protein EVA_20454, partial [gut metagenome]
DRNISINTFMDENIEYQNIDKIDNGIIYMFLGDIKISFDQQGNLISK